MSQFWRGDDVDDVASEGPLKEPGPPPPPRHDDSPKGIDPRPPLSEKDRTSALDSSTYFLTSETFATSSTSLGVGDSALSTSTFVNLPTSTSQARLDTSSEIETNSYVQPLSTPQPTIVQSGPIEDGPDHGFDSRLIAAIVTPLIFFLVLAVFLLLFMRRRRRRGHEHLLQGDRIEQMKLEGVSRDSTPTPQPHSDPIPQPDPPTTMVLSRAPPMSNTAYFTGIDTSDTVSIGAPRPTISAVFSDVQREDPPPPYRPRSVRPSVPRKPVPLQEERATQSNDIARRHTNMTHDSISEISSPMERWAMREGREMDNVSMISDLSYQGEAVSPVQGV